jgi:hypothetical protein
MPRPPGYRLAIPTGLLEPLAIGCRSPAAAGPLRAATVRHRASWSEPAPSPIALILAGSNLSDCKASTRESSPSRSRWVRSRRLHMGRTAPWVRSRRIRAGERCGGFVRAESMPGRPSVGSFVAFLRVQEPNRPPFWQDWVRLSHFSYADQPPFWQDWVRLLDFP